MRIVSEHSIVFEHDIENTVIEDINDPAYIYQVGDKISLHIYEEKTDKPKVINVEVTDVVHEVWYPIINGEQTIRVYITEILPQEKEK